METQLINLLFDIVLRVGISALVLGVVFWGIFKFVSPYLEDTHGIHLKRVLKFVWLALVFISGVTVFLASSPKNTLNSYHKSPVYNRDRIINKDPNQKTDEQRLEEHRSSIEENSIEGKDK